MFRISFCLEKVKNINITVKFHICIKLEYYEVIYSKNIKIQHFSNFALHGHRKVSWRTVCQVA